MLLSNEHASPCISSTHGLLEYTGGRKQLKKGLNHSLLLSPEAA